MAGIRVEDATTTYERVTGKILIDDLRPSWLIFSDGFRVSRLTRWMKRAIDLTLSLVLAVLSRPRDAADRDRDRCSSPGGPVLYCQERVGENGRTFTLCKFRSMRTDAEKAGTAGLGQGRRRPRHARRPLHPQDASRRTAADLERACAAT